MECWKEIYRKNHGVFCVRQRNRRILRELVLERLTVAYDLAAAFFYLHENRLVYRDIKPENIGFDVRGTFILRRPYRSGLTVVAWCYRRCQSI